MFVPRCPVKTAQYASPQKLFQSDCINFPPSLKGTVHELTFTVVLGYLGLILYRVSFFIFYFSLKCYASTDMPTTLTGKI